MARAGNFFITPRTLDECRRILHPLAVEVYYHFTWTRLHHPFWEQVLLAAGLLAVVIALSSATYLIVERPAQNLGRRVGRWLDAKFGPDRLPDQVRVTARPAMAGQGRPATE